jgi:hypothetical protein
MACESQQYGSAVQADSGVCVQHTPMSRPSAQLHTARYVGVRNNSTVGASNALFLAHIVSTDPEVDSSLVYVAFCAKNRTMNIPFSFNMWKTYTLVYLFARRENVLSGSRHPLAF